MRSGVAWTRPSKRRAEPALLQRIEFGDLCAALRIRRAVEVGTDCGVFAEAFLQRWNECAAADARPECLLCIDPWEPYPHMPFDRTPDLMMAVALLARFRSQVRLMRAKSVEVAATISGLRYHSPGFVYLDGDHEYAAVRTDIEAWWPVVTKGGILAGHDYVHEAPGVRAAVDEFVHANELELHLTKDGDEANSWWVTKPW